MPGLVAQGVQVAGPAYGLLLDAWGEDFLAHGELDLRFVGMVVAGDTIEARIEIAADLEGAVIEVTNTSAGREAGNWPGPAASQPRYSPSNCCRSFFGARSATTR